MELHGPWGNSLMYAFGFDSTFGDTPDPDDFKQPTEKEIAMPITQTLETLLRQQERLADQISRLQDRIELMPPEPENDLDPDEPVLVLARIKFRSTAKVYSYALIKTPIGWFASGGSLNKTPSNHGQSWEEMMSKVLDREGRIIELWQATELGQLV